MAVYRVDVLVDDPQPVFDWIEAHVPKRLVLRHVAYCTVRGWFHKVVFKRQDVAESFHRHWHPEADDHSVPPFGKRN